MWFFTHHRYVALLPYPHPPAVGYKSRDFITEGYQGHQRSVKLGRIATEIIVENVNYVRHMAVGTFSDLVYNWLVHLVIWPNIVSGHISSASWDPELC